MAGTSQAAPGDRGRGSSRDDRPDPATEAFLAHRNLLFTVAYEMPWAGSPPQRRCSQHRSTATRR